MPVSTARITTNPAGTVATDGTGDFAWNDLNNIKTDDTNYTWWGAASGGAISDGLELTNFGFNIPTNAIIDGITVSFDIQFQSGEYDVSVALEGVSSENRSAGGSLQPSYGGAEDLWGATIAPSDVNNSSFGVRVVVGDISGGDATIYLEYMTITVHWHYDFSVDPAEVPVRHDYKIYNPAGQYLGNLQNVVSEFGYNQEINSVGSQINVEVAQSIDASSPPLALGHLNSWFVGWDYRSSITIPRSAIGADLDSFPVYVDLSTLGADFWDNVDTNGDDIRITAQYGAIELPFELVGIDTSAKTGELYFKADLVTSVDNIFYIYWGNSTASPYAASDPYGSDNVWDSFTGVYHLEAGAEDSSVESNNGSGVATPTYATGKLGKGVSLNGTSQYVSFGAATSSLDNDMAGETTFSLSVWFKKSAASNYSGQPMILSINGSDTANKLLIYGSNASGNIALYDVSVVEITSSGINTADGNWHKLRYVRNGSTGYLYLDGVLQGSHTASFSLAAGDYWTLGGEYDTGPVVNDFWAGMIDEYRVRSIIVSAEWEAAEYANQSSPSTFYTVGARELEDTSEPTKLIKNGNLIAVYETNYYYPNGKLMFQGQINRLSARFNPKLDGIIKMLCHSDGRDMDNLIARGAPFSYTTDQSNTSNTSSVAVSGDIYGGWTRRGQTFTVGGGVTNLGRIRLRLKGNATVTVSVYGSTSLNPLLGSVTKAVNVGSATVVDFLFSDFIDVTAGEQYFFTVAVNAGQSIQIYYANNTNPYANGGMYTSTYSGGSGGGGYSPNANDDLYFTTAYGTPSTNASYTTDDPTADMLTAIIDDYINRGGNITYDSGEIEATGLSLNMDFISNTIYEAIKKILDASPSGFYYAVDLGENKLRFKEANTTPDYLLVKGKHIEALDLDFSIENVVNDVLFSGGDTGGGSNLFTQYVDNTSKALYGTRLDRKSDNRVTVQGTADAIGESKIAEYKDEQYYTTLSVLARTMDITLLKVGVTIGFRGYGNFIDNMILQITRVEYSADRVRLQVGTLPIRFNDSMEEVIRGLIAEQTVNNPSSPS